jgi:uncharacterized protein (TIGR00251 family)
LDVVITAGSDGVFIDVHIQPRASRGGVRGVHGQRLKIGVVDPPEAGKANTATIYEIACVLNVRVGEVSLVSGTRSRHKRVFVRGLSVDAATQLVMDAIHGAK